MDFTTCKTILRGDKGVRAKFDSAIVFRTFKIVVEKAIAKKKGNWTQILLDFDFRTLTWDWNQFQSILLLFASLSLLSDHSNYPCSLTTVLQQQYVAELCDVFIIDLIAIKEWTPLQWRAVHNMSRIVSLSLSSKQAIMLYSLRFVKVVPDKYEEYWIQNCASFCHCCTTAVFLFIEIYQANTEHFKYKKDFMKPFISLVYYFDSYKLGSPVENDISTLQKTTEKEKEVDANISIPTTWAKKLVEKIVTFMMIVFRQHFADGSGVSLQHALLGLDFPSSHVQTVSLMVVLCHLKAMPTEKVASSKSVHKTGEHAKAVQNSNTVKEKTKLRGQVKKVRNALKFQDEGKNRKSPQFRVCESLYQSGIIRKIYWCLLNKCYNVRMLALEILSTFETVLGDEKNDQKSSWQSYIIEQGLVPLLELLACGFPIASSQAIPVVQEGSNEMKSSDFPEHTICMFAQAVLFRLAAMVADDVALQDKLLLSLVHTKNTCIRGNIFAGLIYLSPKNAAISKLLMRCPTKEGGSTKSIFAEILSEIYVEGSLHDLKNIVKIMYHYFHTRNRQVELIVTKSTPAVIKKKDNRIVKEKLSLSTEILIRDKFNGSLVKMLCPDRETLKAHSNCLLTLMMESVESKPDSNSKEGSLSTLPGHYHIWQEIFSHMIDDVVMDTTLAGTGVSEIVKLYQYSCRYELTHLCMRYSKELVNRLSSESFIQIFQCAISTMMTEFGAPTSVTNKIDHPSAFNLQTFPSKMSLCCRCVRFFIERMSKLSSPHNLQRKIIISEALELYFQFLLIAH